jgi:hypothetical protein
MMRAPLPIAALTALALGCVRSLPPAQPAPASPLSPETGPPAEGAGHVVLEAGPGRVRVDEMVSLNPRFISVIKDVRYEHRADGERVVVYTYGPQEVTDQRLYPRCEAPCTLELPVGPHDLHLQSIEDGRWAYVPIEVTPTQRRYRIGLGHTVSRNDVAIEFVFGTMFLVPGLSLLTAAAVDWAGLDRQPTPEDHDRVQRDSIGLTVFGGALLVAGIVGFVLLRPVAQDTVVQLDSQ